MNKIVDAYYLLGTSFLVLFNFTLDFTTLKNIILFVVTMAVLLIRGKVYYKQLKKLEQEELSDDKEIRKKN